MRQVRNCFSSPTATTSLMKGIASLILISMGTGRMLAPLVKIINSGGETGSDEKGVEKKRRESCGRRAERKGGERM